MCGGSTVKVGDDPVEQVLNFAWPGIWAGRQAHESLLGQVFGFVRICPTQGRL
jgi:hypothetical protein